jgi:hypothetical protein
LNIGLSLSVETDVAHQKSVNNAHLFHFGFKYDATCISGLGWTRAITAAISPSDHRVLKNQLLGMRGMQLVTHNQG